ncbi:phosphonate ABC transporter ATP-binding protein [Thermaurantimonas aggregans]|uniref:Cell division ATP-binding protein FtsE n=1 Tax=Thermaurantimonas aggregans TaxID=2173829 RepID=A0A401XJE9_9FLAO|nr:ATP-binding cassette domain-containing protein [Thermaurantimonas aggregans]MCX8147855.1 ATP-binding cassette domain-containing protein [Thermaurantimonas aggregans]GCD77101.1 phosphonate ABC transporter ATP-binding protein [Thermaurantimonas aggregans]
MNTNSQPIVSLIDAAVGHGKEPVLAGINLFLHPGEFVYLIGETGSGKSTLLKTLYADLPLIAGEAHVAGYALHRLKRKQIPYLRRQLGIIFQDFQLLPDRTVYDNLLFVLRATGWKEKKHINERIERVLSSVAMLDKAKKMPHQLSGGEQQRVSVARALLNEPKLIIADEPTGNLDPDTSEEIILLIRELVKSDRSVLMATHDYNIIMKFPAPTLRCQAGKVISVLKPTL